MAINLGQRIEPAGVTAEPKAQPTPVKSKLSITMCLLGLILVYCSFLLISVCKDFSDKVDDFYIDNHKHYEDTCKKQQEINDSLVAMHQVLDVNGIIIPQSPNAPVRFIVVLGTNTVSDIYESKGGVISKIPKNQIEIVMRK